MARRLVLLALVSLAGHVQSAQAQSYTILPNATIPDNNATYTCFAIPVPDAGIVANVSVSIAMSHTWIGDLRIQLRSPAGSALTILQRPGSLGYPGSTAGDSSNLDPSFPLTYLDGAPNDAEAMGNTITDMVVCGDDGQCQYFANRDSDPTSPLVNFAGFSGESRLGSWQICFSDLAPGDTGVVSSVTLTVAAASPPQADLSITKTDGQATEVPGTSITYTIVASNAGPSVANGATVADTVPAAITSATWTCLGAGGGTCAANGSGNINDSANLPVGGTVTYTLTGTISPSATGSLSNTATVTAPGGVTDPNPANNSATDTDTLVGLDFFSLPPCRVVDTRGGAPIGGPVMQGQETRAFTVAGNCGIPLTAKAVSINLTVTAATVGGNVRLFPAGQPVPTASTINYVAGQNRANNAVIPLDATGALAAFVAQPAGTTVHLVIDVNGYFE